MAINSLIRLLNNLPGLVYRTRNNRNWTMEFASDGCFELTGYRPDELIDDRLVSYNDLIHPDYRGIVWDEAQKALQEKPRCATPTPSLPRAVPKNGCSRTVSGCTTRAAMPLLWKGSSPTSPPSWKPSSTCIRKT